MGRVLESPGSEGGHGPRVAVGSRWGRGPTPVVCTVIGVRWFSSLTPGPPPHPFPLPSPGLERQWGLRRAPERRDGERVGREEVGTPVWKGSQY